MSLIIEKKNGMWKPTTAKKQAVFSTNPQRDFYNVYEVPLMFLHNQNIHLMFSLNYETLLTTRHNAVYRCYIRLFLMFDYCYNTCIN